jgi:nucleoside-diphosphate-sugar epimerase
MVYGPGQRDLTKLVPYVISSLLRGEAPRLSSGVRRVDWVYVDDVADAFIAAATTDGAAGGAIEVGSGVLTSIREVVGEIVEIVGADVKPGFGDVADRPMDQEWRADPAPAARMMGWRSGTALAEGLRTTVDWYAERMRSGELSSPG